MKKRLNVTAITNELKGQSRFFEESSKPVSGVLKLSKRPNDRTREHANARALEQLTARTDEHKNKRASERPNVNRRIIRYSFQFYADQIEALKLMRARMELQGVRRDLSQLAREAFANFLKRTHERMND